MNYEKIKLEIDNICNDIQKTINNNPSEFIKCNSNTDIINKLLKKIKKQLPKLLINDIVNNLNKHMTISERKHYFIITDEYNHKLTIQKKIAILARIENDILHITFNIVPQNDLNFISITENFKNINKKIDISTILIILKLEGKKETSGEFIIL